MSRQSIFPLAMHYLGLHIGPPIFTIAMSVEIAFSPVFNPTISRLSDPEYRHARATIPPSHIPDDWECSNLWHAIASTPLRRDSTTSAVEMRHNPIGAMR